MELDKWVKAAKEVGFDTAAEIDVATLQPMEMVRDACQADRCRAYGHNWTCPPECGTLEECGERMHGYHSAILLQTIGRLQKAVDTHGYMAAEQRHREQIEAFAALVRKEYPKALILGSGGCRICETCAYPEPCRFPDRRTSSMEAYGLFVTQVCRDNGVEYYYGPKTIAYVGCVLLD